MTGFAVIRHPETGGVGTAPAEAMDHYRNQGWVRVSDYAPSPQLFHLPAFADASDLDAVAEETPEPGTPDDQNDTEE